MNHPGCLALGYVDIDGSIVHVKIEYCPAVYEEDDDNDNDEQQRQQQQQPQGAFRTFVGHRGGHETFTSLSQLVLDFRKAVSLHMGSKEEMLLRLSQVAAAATKGGGGSCDDTKSRSGFEASEETNGYIPMAKEDFKNHQHRHQQPQQGQDDDDEEDDDDDQHQQQQQQQQHQHRAPPPNERLAPSFFSVDTAPQFWKWVGKDSVTGVEWKEALKMAFWRHTRARRSLSDKELNLLLSMVSGGTSKTDTSVVVVVYRNEFERWYKSWYEPFCCTVCRIRFLWDSFVVLGVTHSRESVRKLLQNDQCGSFVVRLSGNVPGSLALGYVNEKRNVVHMQIITGRRKMAEDNAFMVELENRKYLKFDTLEELVTALTPAKVLHPIPKECLFDP
eukprot:CAMPEP_0185261876 /NCGR_PEP_ID=MMETSP1359-20130426/10176_1 /TAXON_ID=552665 /ORGANISM="Bigelowiella longifila, Strain CCMP242" /LENGTH=388 /DNA_ID=CAMNT_0027848655 /DNA_START=492 /DNA_END=1658 /DNA_ORIENTATION=-